MNSKYNFECEVFASIDELEPKIQELVQLARKQTERSYAPYSNFHVGAALLLESGEIYLGCNQENASYPLCMCAERVALYNLGAEKEKFKIKALAITATNPDKPLEEVCMPCGACRQVIHEFEQRQDEEFDIYITSENNEIVKIDGIETLLPHSFTKNLLL